MMRRELFRSPAGFSIQIDQLDAIIIADFICKVKEIFGSAWKLYPPFSLLSGDFPNGYGKQRGISGGLKGSNGFRVIPLF
jgi:hypothetical protein